MPKKCIVRLEGSGPHRFSCRNRPRPSAHGRFRFWWLVAALVAPALWAADERPRSKYGPAATRLYEAREYIQRNAAPDFWALIPYYVPQHNDSSCSAAGMAMLVNGLRAARPLDADNELVTPAGLLELIPAGEWKEKVASGGPGVTLDELGRIVPRVLKAYDIGHARIEIIRLDHDTEGAARLRRLLAENERSDRDLILANFLQSALTGDPAGAVGHIAPIAAYDARRDRVLILDPDRRWYEPYWVAVESLLAAMDTEDPVSHKPRGLIRVAK